MKSSTMLAINDIIDGAKRWPLWLNLAWEDIATTYRRTSLGVVWVTLTFALFVGAKVLIFVPIIRGTNDSTYYSLFLALGFTSWQFISNVILGAANVFIAAGNWLKNDSLPVSVFAFQLTARSGFNFSLTLIAMTTIIIFLRVPISWISLASLLAIPIYLITSFSLAIILGFACTRFRDFKQIVDLSVRLLLFLSPIFWMPEIMGDVFENYLKWNPIVYYIDIFRSPILDQTININSWLIVSAVTFALITSSFVVLVACKRRLVFWI